MNFHNPPMIEFSRKVMLALRHAHASSDSFLNEKLTNENKHTYKTREKIITQLIKCCRIHTTPGHLYRLASALHAQCVALTNETTQSPTDPRHKDSLESQYAVFLWLYSKSSVKSIFSQEQNVATTLHSESN